MVSAYVFHKTPTGEYVSYIDGNNDYRCSILDSRNMDQQRRIRDICDLHSTFDPETQMYVTGADHSITIHEYLTGLQGRSSPRFVNPEGVEWSEEMCCEYSLIIASVLEFLFVGVRFLKTMSDVLPMDEQLLQQRVLELSFQAMNEIIDLGKSFKDLPVRERSALMLAFEFCHNNSRDHYHSENVQCFACMLLKS